MLTPPSNAPTVQQPSLPVPSDMPSLPAPDMQSSLPECRLVKNREGGNTLVVEGVKFFYNKTTLSGHLWRCSYIQEKCKVTCKTNMGMDGLLFISGSHNHVMGDNDGVYNLYMLYL